MTILPDTEIGVILIISTSNPTTRSIFQRHAFIKLSMRNYLVKNNLVENQDQAGVYVLYRIQHDWSARTIEVMDQREKLGRFYCSLF